MTAGRLNGKVVIVTGAARGLGREYALRLAAAGAGVIAADIRDCAETIAAIGNDTAIGVSLDVTDLDSCHATARAAYDKFGRIDGLVNNAALYATLPGGRFDTLKEADWDAAMAVNVKGVWNCCRAVAPSMREAGGGSIVNITSLAAIYGMPYALHYATSKAAVIGLTRSLARELGRDLIRVNAVAPSAVMTEATKEFFGEKLEKAKKTIAAGQCIQRNLEPEDVSGTVVYLISDDSKFVTGQTVMVDGGSVFL